jgi:site-specific recombinase XerD
MAWKRSSVRSRSGPPNSPFKIKRMPTTLQMERHRSVLCSPDDYVFGSETMMGKQPFWPDNLMKREIRPVAKANGIHEKIGWHASRHSFVTLLKANGEDVKTVQELL